MAALHEKLNYLLEYIQDDPLLITQVSLLQQEIKDFENSINEKKEMIDKEFARVQGQFHTEKQNLIKDYENTIGQMKFNHQKEIERIALELKNVENQLNSALYLLQENEIEMPGGEK